MKKKYIAILIMVLMTLMALILLVTLMCLNSSNMPILVAHRGGRIEGVENTKQAYLSAINNNAKFLETDVFFTSDNIPMLFHDETLDDFVEKDSPYKGVDIRTLSYQELKDITISEKVNGKIYTSKILTLDEFLNICIEYNVTPVIEIKNDLTNHLEQLDIIIYKLKEQKLEEKAIVISFTLDNLLYIKEKAPNIDLQWVCKKNVWDNLDICIEKEIDIDVKWLYCTRRLVNVCHKNNLKINVWTVNSNVKIKHYQSIGVDYITTDRKLSW